MPLTRLRIIELILISMTAIAVTVYLPITMLFIIAL
jgi:hypothetical protein